jgi:hypothetical protein
LPSKFPNFSKFFSPARHFGFLWDASKILVPEGEKKLLLSPMLVAIEKKVYLRRGQDSESAI